MLRSYNSSTPFYFYFSFRNSNIQPRDARILTKIETDINNMTTKVRAIGITHVDINDLVFKYPGKQNLIVKCILNQYDIECIEYSKWCGLRKITHIKPDKLIYRIINNSDRIQLVNSKPINHIVSNAIDIQHESPKSNENTLDERESRRLQLNENRGDYRRSRNLD